MTNFTFSNPKTVDASGSVFLDCLVSDNSGDPIESFGCFVEGSTVFEEANAAAAIWVANNSGLIPSYVTPALEEEKASAKSQILNSLQGLVSLITVKYLNTDPVRWAEKEAEATAFNAIPDANQTLADAPTIAPPFHDAYPSVTDAEILIMVQSEMDSILANAVIFRAIDEFTNAIRIKYYPIVDATANSADLLTVVANAQDEIEQFVTDNMQA